MKTGITIAELAEAVGRIGARLRAARLGQPLPQPPAPAAALAPRAGPQAELFAAPVPPQVHKGMRYASGGTLPTLPPGSPWLRGEWCLHGTDTGRMRCDDPARSNELKGDPVLQDLSSIELRVLANMTTAERQAMLDNAPPGTHWMIEESAPLDRSYTESLRVPDAKRRAWLYGEWDVLTGEPQRCPWDDWKPGRELA